MVRGSPAEPSHLQRADAACGGGAGSAEAGKELEVCGSGGLSPRSGRKNRIGGTKPGID